MRSVRKQLANTILRDFTQFYAICYRIRSVRYQFATVCAVYANKADHMLILPIYLNQVLNNEKVKNQKKLFLTQSSGPQRNLKQLFFCANSKSKIVASVHCAYTSKDKMVRIWPTLKKIIFYFIREVPYLHDIKIIKIEEIKNLTLGNL
jgi:hypothetical protein